MGIPISGIFFVIAVVIVVVSVDVDVVVGVIVGAIIVGAFVVAKMFGFVALKLVVVKKFGFVALKLWVVHVALQKSVIKRKKMYMQYRGAAPCSLITGDPRILILLLSICFGPSES